MECTRIHGYDGDDFAHVVSERFTRARLPHTCMECGEQIHPGQLCYRERFVLHGKFTEHFTCHACKSLRDELFCSWTYGALWEDLRAEIDSADGELSMVAISRLHPKARAKVCDILEEYWAGGD